MFGSPYRSGNTPFALSSAGGGGGQKKRRRRMKSGTVKKLLAFCLPLSHTCEPGCLLSEVVDPGLDCVRACFHSCIWRSVLLIRGRKGWGSECEGRGGPTDYWLIETQDIFFRKDVKQLRPSHRGSRKVEKSGDPGRNECISYKSLGAFSFHSFSFFPFLCFHPPPPPSSDLQRLE